MLAKVPGLLPQAPLEQRAHKLSYFTEGQPGIVGQVRAALERAGLRCSVIHSHGRYLDVLPIRASKGTAVDFVRARLGLTPDAVFVAGDSANDIEMLRTIPQAIIVGNFSDGLAAMRRSATPMSRTTPTRAASSRASSTSATRQGPPHASQRADAGSRPARPSGPSDGGAGATDACAGRTRDRLDAGRALRRSARPRLSGAPRRRAGRADAAGRRAQPAAAAAHSELLVFLDVDCIPAPTVVEAYLDAADARDGLFLGEVLYLPAGATAGGLDFARLDRLGEVHPSKPPVPREGVREEPNAGELWGLSFALPAERWRAVGGMDESFVGYGRRGTDFAVRLAASGLPFFWTAGARCYHQHHPVRVPPLHHFDHILRNAELFRERHGRWCMDYWLGQFRDAGLIDWRDDAIRVLRRPSSAEVEASGEGAADACSPDGSAPVVEPGDKPVAGPLQGADQHY